MKLKLNVKMILKIFTMSNLSLLNIIPLTALLVIVGYVFFFTINSVFVFCDQWSSTLTTDYLLISVAESNSSQQSMNNDLPAKDKFILIDMQNFEFTINRNTCDTTAPLLLIMIVSAPDHFERRQLLRKTWVRKRESVAFLFLLGSSKEHQQRLKQENTEYGDILQGNFIDVYDNLTYKHVMGLKWITYYCQDIKYALKVDDDVFVNVPAILDFIKYSLSTFGARQLILCEPQYHAPVQRSLYSKWRVSKEEYPENWYPNFCSGWSVLYTPDIVFLLYHAANIEPYFRLEDVHITGTLVKKLNLRHTSLDTLVLLHTEMYDIFSNHNTDYKNFLFGPPHISGKDIEALYNLTMKKYTYRI